MRLPIKTVILDFDGTLASSLEGIWTCMRETLAHYNFAEPTLQQVRATIGLTLEESMHRLTEGRCEESLTSEMVKFYRALHTTKAAPLTRLFDGPLPTLAELRARNIVTILVSNKGRAGLHQLITQLEIASYIELVLSAEDVSHRKPDARLYTEHIAPLTPGTPDEQTLGYGDEQRCKALSPDFELHKLTDLPALIANFTK
jgi:phosphoglycolate phosphatase